MEFARLAVASLGTRDGSPKLLPSVAPMVPPNPAADNPPPFSPVAALALLPESLAALSDLDRVRLMLRDYRTLMGGNPVGTNAEIMKAIMGGNPKGAKLGPPGGMSLNEEGELLTAGARRFSFTKSPVSKRRSGPPVRIRRWARAMT